MDGLNIFVEWLLRFLSHLSAGVRHTSRTTKETFVIHVKVVYQAC